MADVRRAVAAAGPARASAAETDGFHPSRLRSAPFDRPTVARARPSAVLVALYDHDGEAWVVLTRRAGHLRAHRGEVSFPGGGQDPADADLVATALREAWEETALDPAAVEIVGELDHLSTVTSRSFIVPWVGVLAARPALVANAAEVDAIMHVALSELLRPDVFHEEHWPLDGDLRPIVFFELVGDTVWGATAAVLRQLLGLVTGTLGRGDLGHD